MTDYWLSDYRGRWIIQGSDYRGSAAISFVLVWPFIEEGCITSCYIHITNRSGASMKNVRKTGKVGELPLCALRKWLELRISCITGLFSFKSSTKSPRNHLLSCTHYDEMRYYVKNEIQAGEITASYFYTRYLSIAR